MSQVDRAGQGDPVQHVAEVVRGGLARPDAGDEAAELLHLVGPLLGVERDGDVKEGEEDDQAEVDGDVGPGRPGWTGARPRTGPTSRCPRRYVRSGSAGWVTRCGMQISDEAKMTGMTPAWLTLSGR